jgi:AcrR family transcriptional regulator
VPTTRRLTPRGKERRSQLLAFATARFAEQGYHPTSVAEIVDGLGVGKGVFYWYFESKEVLFVEILRDAQKDMRRRQQRAVADLSDPVEQIGLGIRAAVHWSAEHRDLFTLFEFAQTDDRFAHLIRKGRDELASDAIPLLKLAIAEGRIPEADPEQLAHAILGVTSNLTMVYLYQRGESPERVAEAAVDFCLRGIGAL